MTVTENQKRLVIVGATRMVDGYALRYAQAAGCPCGDIKPANPGNAMEVGIRHAQGLRIACDARQAVVTGPR
jgi:hypothetical protein